MYVLTITKVLTKTTNCAFGAKKRWGTTKKNFRRFAADRCPHFCSEPVPPSFKFVPAPLAVARISIQQISLGTTMSTLYRVYRRNIQRHIGFFCFNFKLFKRSSWDNCWHVSVDCCIGTALFLLLGWRVRLWYSVSQPDLFTSRWCLRCQLVLFCCSWSGHSSK